LLPSVPQELTKTKSKLVINDWHKHWTPGDDSLTVTTITNCL